MMMTPDTGPMGFHRVFTRSHEPPHVFRSLSPMMTARTSLATRPGKSSNWSLKKYNWSIVKYLHVLWDPRHLLSVNTRLSFLESVQSRPVCLSLNIARARHVRLITPTLLAHRHFPIIPSHIDHSQSLNLRHKRGLNPLSINSTGHP